jgi:hypothetical protein
VVPPAEPPITLAELRAEDLEPVGGLVASLKAQGIEIVVDDIGRECVARSDARRLFDQRREAEVRRAEIQRRHEEELAEAAARAPRGAPMIEGMSALESMLVASPPDEPKRRKSVLETALDNDGAEFFPIREEP